MGGNPFKEIGNAISGVFKGVTNIVGGVLGLKQNKEGMDAPAPAPEKPVNEVTVDTSGTENKIRKNRRRSSFGGTFVASKNALGAGSGVSGKRALGL